MKKKIYLIFYAVVQVVISIYSMINVNAIAKTQVKLIADMFKDMPKGMQTMMAEAYSLEVMKSSVMLTAVVCLVLGLILLWLFVRDRVPVKKGLTIGLVITSMVLGLSDLILILSIIALILVIKTEKKKITDTVRIETEEEITLQEYENLRENADANLVPVRKTRYCLMHNGKYFEIDIFPFWIDKAYVEIELTDENEYFELPEFLKVIKEVTQDKNYTNRALAYRLKNNEI